MGLSDETMAKLVEGHAVERTLLRDVTRRYERATTAAAKAREALDAAEAERVAVLAEWAAAPGWDAERIAEAVHLQAREVTEATRAASPTAAPPAAPDPVHPPRGLPGAPGRRAGFAAGAHGDDRQSVVA